MRAWLFTSALCAAVAVPAIARPQDPKADPADTPARPNVVEVANEVEGRTTIIKLVPDGATVKKGQVICELDSASLRDQLNNQLITAQRAEADCRNAEKTREVAEIHVKEYREGTFPLEMQQLEGEATVADSELILAIDQLADAEKSKDAKAIRDAKAAKLRAEVAKRTAAGKLQLLVKHTSPRRITELKGEIDKARADELAKKSTVELEKVKAEKLRRQIDKCEIRSPIDGRLAYVNTPPRAADPTRPLIEEGAIVRERQKLFRITPSSTPK